jgi:methylated-DNA-[protein]-cysteine S-methyltransferase
MAAKIHLDVFEAGFLGMVGLAVSSNGLLRVRMRVRGEQEFLSRNQTYQEGEYVFDPELTLPFRSQILAYVRRELQEFSLPVDWGRYTPFQLSVLKATQAIPYGETRSYGQVAGVIGRPNAARAVGQAEKRNQVPLVIPCHRVIGSNGSLIGYGGSADTELKASLIAFEKDNRDLGN